jgi:DNA-binding NarL/FixJ family response regulator
LQMERECLRLRRLTDDLLGIALCLEALAWITAADDPTRATTLLGAASALMKVTDTSTALLPDLHALHASCVDQVRRVLGDAYTGWFDSGARLDRTSAISFALGEPTPHSADERAVSQQRAVLTRREREIATLVAEGLSNKEIADRLVIAKRTAETHVENILSKLGFTSRVQIAMWTSEQSA